MGFFSRFNPWRKPARRQPTAREQERVIERYREIVATYDAAAFTNENARHWQHIDYLSPSASVSHDVRRTLRARCRHEIGENSSLGKGIALRAVADTVGRGPKPQVDLKTLIHDRREARKSAQQIEASFRAWARQSRFGRRLRGMWYSQLIDGEAFAVESTNTQLRHPVQLGIRQVEADQVDHWKANFDDTETNGIRFDKFGNPTEYYLLKHHPGSNALMSSSILDTITIPASSMIHLYREDRPEQRRGVPWLTPSLPLFAFRRRFILATIAAAEIAAAHAGVLQSDGTAYDETPFDPNVAAFKTLELDRGMFTTLPFGWKLEQMKAEHPSTTFEMFDNAIVGEVARCMLMPYGRAAANHKGFTYASGKLDQDSWYSICEINQDDCALTCCDPIFDWWLYEAAFVPGVLPDVIASAIRIGRIHACEVNRTWIFDRKRESDVARQAAADVNYHKAGLLPDKLFFERSGIDAEDVYEMFAEQVQRRNEVGMPIFGSIDHLPVTLDELDAMDNEDANQEAASMEVAA